MGVSSEIMRELTKRYLQSVVSVKVNWNYGALQVMQSMTCAATGFIIYSCPDFMFILTCSHTFKSFAVCDGPAYDSVDILNSNTNVIVSFFDRFESWGHVHCIEWWKDLCVILVPFPEKSYAPVKFVGGEEDSNGQSIYSRGTKVYSIFCVPTNQQLGNLLFGTTVKGKICGRNNIMGDDLGPEYPYNLRFFEMDMIGPQGCSGAPVFNQDFFVIGMRMAKAGDVMFALKFNEIREWADTWFNTEKAKSMEEAVAIASGYTSMQLQEKVKIQAAELGLPAIEYTRDDFEL